MMGPAPVTRRQSERSGYSPALSSRRFIVLQRWLRLTLAWKSCEHRQVVRSALLVAGRYTTELLQPIDQALDDVAGSVQGAVEPFRTRLVASGRDDRTDPVEPQVGAYGPSAVALVTHQSARAATWPSTA